MGGLDLEELPAEPVDMMFLGCFRGGMVCFFFLVRSVQVKLIRVEVGWYKMNSRSSWVRWPVLLDSLYAGKELGGLTRLPSFVVSFQ